MQPSASELLQRIASATPWFPRQAPDAAQLAPVLDQLWQARLIEARDWEKGLGQGFGLTARGEEAIRSPHLLARMLSESPASIASHSRPTTYDRGERARGAYFDELHKPLVTQLLISANLALFVAGLYIAWQFGNGRMAYLNGSDSATLHRLGMVNGGDLLRGEWWRLIAANFVHIGFVHLLLNLYGLALVGTLAENLWGRWRFALIYLLGGLGGSVLAMILRPGTSTAGASGAIWGVMASLFVWIYQYRQHFEADVIGDFARRLALAVGLNVLFSFLPNVSWQGHLGGAIAGTLAAIVLDWIRPGYRRRIRAGIAATILLPAVMIGLLLWAIAKTERWRPVLAREAARQQVEYLLPIRKALAAIDQRTAQILVADTANVRDFRIFDKLMLRAKTLQTDAESLKQQLPSSPGRLVPDMPAKLERYCDAVRELALRLQEYHEAQKADFSRVQQALKNVDDCWLSLFQSQHEE